MSIGDENECKLVGKLGTCGYSLLGCGCWGGDKKWGLEVEGSACGGRGFGPCSYPSGWTLNYINENHYHHDHVYII